MLPFSEALSHPGEPLTEHLRAVSSNGTKQVSLAANRVRMAVQLMGLIHDAGKATPWFQDHLFGKGKKRDERTHHAKFSALLAHYILKNRKVFGRDGDWVLWTVVIGIMKHHGNLDCDVGTFFTNLKADVKRSDAIREQLNEFDGEGFFNWLRIELNENDIKIKLDGFEKEQILNSMNDFFPSFSNPFKSKNDGFDFLISFGAFVGADKMDAADLKINEGFADLSNKIVDNYKKDKFGPPLNDLDATREEIYNEVMTFSTKGPKVHIHTLTAPTGAGKTLIGLAAGLRFREIKKRNGLSKLIYCLPFTSIIDQNYDVYRKVIENANITADSRTLLKHHHLSGQKYMIEDEMVTDGADLLVETWQSDIVVTTFHQFLYTLFTFRNKNLKRISAIQNAVVILDEVQSIPHEYWDAVREMFLLCSERFKTTFILMTATMPLIISPSDEKELLKSYISKYEKLSRTTLFNKTRKPIKLGELASKIREKRQKGPDKSMIVILNRRKAVRELFNELRGQKNIFMLSTDLTPLHRKEILNSIDNPFLLITTQLIEAGVDISAHEVIRDIAPLDCLIQSAGRCNRNQESEKGRVEIIELHDDNDKRLSTWVYSSFLIETTLEVLKEYAEVDESSYHKLAKKYYRLIKDRSDQKEILNSLSKGFFNKLEGKEGLQLIKNRAEQPYFIIQNDEDKRVWDLYIAIKNTEIRSKEDFYRRRERYRNIKRDFMERIVNYPIKGEAKDEVIPIYPDSKSYDPECGLFIDPECGFEFL